MFSLTWEATQSHSALRMAKIKDKDIDIDDTVFQKRVRSLARKLGRNEKELIKEQTGILAREVARMTPPYAVYPKLSNAVSAGTAKDIKAGKDAMFGDMLKICSTRKSPTITWAKKTFKGGAVIFEKQVAAGVITNESELHQWHRSNRKKGNRTNWLPAYARMWVAPVLLNRYLKKEYQRVGNAKATFYKAALSLGAKVTAPANVKKNTGRASGSGKVTKGLRGAVGTIKGRSGGLYHTIKFMPMLRRNRLIKAVKRGEFLMKKAVKDSEFKVV